MVLSRGLRDEVKTAFWGRAVDRQVVGLAWGLAHHPTPACLHQLSPNSRSVVRTCSTLDKQTAVTEGQKPKGREPGFVFYFGFYPIPRDTTLRTDGHGTVNIGNGGKPHSKLRPSTIEPPVAFPLRYISMVPADGISGRSPRSRSQARQAQLSLDGAGG